MPATVDGEVPESGTRQRALYGGHRLKALLVAEQREDTLEQERQLLYVSVTRARDAVFVTWAGEPSRFLIRKARKGRQAK